MATLPLLIWTIVFSLAVLEVLELFLVGTH